MHTSLVATILTFLLVTFSGSAHSEEILLIGNVDAILLLPAGSAQCPELNGAQKNPDGSTLLTISNDCGCETATLHVDHVLTGKVADTILKLSKRTGEWCRPSYPLSTRNALFQINGKNVHWSMLKEIDGRQFFSAARFQSLNGTAIGEFPHDKNGQIALDDVLKTIPAAR
ncbi:MAG: hypothetical protein KGM99_11590 [Burkholderiales bacterium]|nr:hypothetical protein [Burkholderiales bacterium]